MTFTTIYFVGAAIGAARGLLELSEIKEELDAGIAKLMAKNRATIDPALITDAELHLVGKIVKGSVYTAVVASNAIAWPLVVAHDIYKDAKLAFT